MDDVIYIVGFAVNGRNVFMGWRSVDLPALSMVMANGEIIHASTAAACLDSLSAMFPGHVYENSLFFDLDTMRAWLKSGWGISADDAVNVWNLFTDISNAMSDEGGSPGGLFEQDCIDAYGRFFAATSAGAMVGCVEEPPMPDDDRILLQVLDHGAAMLGRFTG